MADKNWIGNALALSEKYTLVIGGTWLATETLSLTIGTKTITLTMGTTVTNAQIATEVASMWNGTPALGAAYSATQTGNNVPEMNEITATVSSATVTFTHDAVAVPFTMSRSLSSASGTATLTNTVDATGPNSLNNVNNFAEGAALASTNDFYVDRPISFLYDLDQSGFTLNSMTIGERFTQAAYGGLPARNANGYEEYREDWFKANITTFTCYGTSGRFKWDAGSVQTTATIYSTGTAAETGRAAFQFRGTHASNAFRIYGGDVGIAANEGDVATVATLTVTGGTVECGRLATLTNVTKTGGTLEIESSTTTLISQAGTTTLRGGTHTALTVGGGTCNLLGSTAVTTLRQTGSSTVSAGPNVTWTTIDKSEGTLTLNSGGTTLTSDSGETTVNAGAITTVNINSGTFNYGGTGTLGTINATNCTLDFDNGTTAGCTVTTLNVTGNVTIIDSAKRVTWTNGLPLINGTITFRSAS